MRSTANAPKRLTVKVNIVKIGTEIMAGNEIVVIPIRFNFYLKIRYEF